jgi:hypothetical protein
MDPKEFLKVASELVAGANPARIRSGISRAYYAAYNVGVEVLTEMGFTIEKGPRGHKDVSMRLHNSGDVEVEKAGSQLGTLQSKRNNADYHLDNMDVEDQKTAQADVELARRIIQILDSCRGGEKKTKVIEGIKDYDRKVGKI